MSDYEKWKIDKITPGTRAYKLAQDTNIQNDYCGYNIIKPILVYDSRMSLKDGEEIYEFVENNFEGGFASAKCWPPHYSCSQGSDAIKLMRFMYCEN